MLYSKFGFMYTDLKFNNEDYILIREDDVIGIMPRKSGLWCATVRVCVRVCMCIFNGGGLATGGMQPQV